MSTTSLNSKKLILFVLVLLPSFFFAWYMNAHLLARLTAWPLNAVLPQAMPEAVHQINPTDRHLLMLSPIGADPRYSKAPPRGGQAVGINLLIYSFSIPLFAALAIASEASSWEHVRRISAGLLLLYLFVVLSATIRVLYLLEFGSRFAHVSPVTEQEALRQLIHHGHYLTVTILPTALPVLLWALMYRKTFLNIVPFGRSHESSPGDTKAKPPSDPRP